MVLNSRELLAGRELTITQRITLKIDIFGFPFFFFFLTQASLSRWLHFSNRTATLKTTPIGSSHFTPQVIFCLLKAEISSYFVLTFLQWRPVDCWCRLPQVIKAPQWPMEEVHVKARGHAAVICCAQCDRAEPSEQRPVHSGWGGGTGGGRSLGPHLVHPHIERALTDFALKRQASFLTTHRNNTTLVSRADTR